VGTELDASTCGLRPAIERETVRIRDRGSTNGYSIKLTVVKPIDTENAAMIDHLAIPVSDLGVSKQFFVAALAPLGYKVIYDLEDAVGMGSEGFPAFWIDRGQPRGPLHIAFAASDRAVVDTFYRAALAAGGRDNGIPGVRADYHPNYYAAFVHDPDGNNVEVVCRKG